MAAKIESERVNLAQGASESKDFDTANISHFFSAASNDEFRINSFQDCMTKRASLESSMRATASRFAPRVKLSEALEVQEVDKIKQLKFYAKRRSQMQQRSRAGNGVRRSLVQREQVFIDEMASS